MTQLDALMDWLQAKLEWLPKLGGGYGWRIGNTVVMLWPFVALAIFIVALVLLDQVIS